MRSLKALISLLFVLFAVTPTQAATIASECATKGQIKLEKNSTYTCQEVEAGLSWVVYKSPNPKPKVTPSRTSSPGKTVCAAGGPCKIGDIGPGGGIVFVAYRDWQEDYESRRNWNAMEVAAPGWYGTSMDPVFDRFCPEEPYGLRKNFVERNNLTVGFGVFNTAYLAKYCSDGLTKFAISFRGGNLSDWHVPSSREIEALDNYSEIFGTKKTYPDLKLDRVKYWTSSPSVVGLIRVYDLASNNYYRDPMKLEPAGLRPIRQFATKPFKAWLATQVRKP